MDLSSWIYLAVFGVTAVAGLSLSRLLPLAPAGGALSAFVASLLSDSLVLSLILFVAVSALLFAALLLRPHRRETSLEAMVGSTCTVVERIDPLTGGQVRVGDGLWAARALTADAAHEVGAVLTVVAIEGVKLICR
ncbi:MAG: NfeD family protein [Clostridia bacterium]|nr:NfeD family protein [Clostridia bacterium]